MLQLIKLGLTSKRAQTISLLAKEVAEGRLKLEAGADVALTMEQLQTIPGIGPWTANYIAMRALSHPDAFPDSDLGLMHALKLKKPREILAMGEPWRPWRAYATLHLWASLSATVNKGG